MTAADLRSQLPENTYKPQVQTTPPSSLRIMIIADLGHPPCWPSGQELTRIGFKGSVRSEGVSPGCWMLIKRLRPSGLEVMPVISHPEGPVRNRFT